MEKKDRNALIMILIFIIGLVAIIFWIASEYTPIAADWFAQNFNDGIGIKAAVVIAFILTTLLLIVLTLVSDGGILGEIQYLLGSFFVFFTVFTFLIAWIF